MRNKEEINKENVIIPQLFENKSRIKPVKNTLIIWPAGYTHFHRGNPPLSGEKYILTGWIEYGDRVIKSMWEK